MHPAHGAAHDNLGVLLARQNRTAEAVESFRRAAAINPLQVPTQMNLAHALLKSGQVSEAVEAFRRVVQLSPDSVRAHEELAAELSRQNRPAEALVHFQHIARLKPDDPRAHFDLALRWAQAGRRAEAIAEYRETLRVKPDSAEARVNLANQLVEDGAVDEAVTMFREAIALRPSFAEAYLNLGSALTKQRKFAEAIDALETAIRIKPNVAESYNNLGIVYGEEGKYSLAADYYRHALMLRPESADALYNLGIARLKLREPQEAIELFDQALRIRPDYAEAHHNRSAANLLLGRLDEGFAEYEWRFRSRDFNPARYRWPAWDGSDPAGRTIVLCAEQGLGDTLQFVRYASLLRKRGARVIVECQEALHPILARTPDVERWITATAPAPPADFCAPLMSLPYLCHTNLETIPADVPYLFADSELVTKWRPRTAEVSGLKVGIVWQGNPKCPSDEFRSVPLAEFAPLAAVSGVRLIKLQKGAGSEQLAEVAQTWNVVDFGDAVDTEAGPFMDTAAIMKCLDLVITSDTATAHLAGGLGVNTWLAVPFVPDWRWLLDRDDCPWYPTMRLFRQAQLHDWSQPFAQMTSELQSLVAAQVGPLR